MFYTFKQNNSGGSFDHDEKAGIGYAVIVEASSEKQAMALALGIGLYFNGCDTNLDCPCCGDRWNDYIEGTEVPSLWSEPMSNFDEGSTWWGIPIYTHYLDGRIEKS